jgi:alpha-tubulin suppressor-like RCC1 family protein
MPEINKFSLNSENWHPAVVCTVGVKQSHLLDRQCELKLCTVWLKYMVPVAGRAFVLPSPIYHPGVKVTQVACGSEHCLLLTENGQVFTWGRGRYGGVSHSNDCLILSCLQSWLAFGFQLGLSGSH